MQTDLLERIEALERRNRRLGVVVWIPMLVLVFMVCVAAVSPRGVTDVLRVRRLEIVDPSGNTRAVFEADRRDVRLMVGDKREEHVEISSEASGSVACVEVGKKKCMELYSKTSDRTGFYLYDRDEKNIGIFEVTSDDNACLGMHEGDYNITASFTDGGRPYIGLFKEKVAGVSLLVKEDGAGSIKLRDPSQ